MPQYNLNLKLATFKSDHLGDTCMTWYNMQVSCYSDHKCKFITFWNLHWRTTVAFFGTDLLMRVIDCQSDLFRCLMALGFCQKKKPIFLHAWCWANPISPLLPSITLSHSHWATCWERSFVRIALICCHRQLVGQFINLAARAIDYFRTLWQTISQTVCTRQVIWRTIPSLKLPADFIYIYIFLCRIERKMLRECGWQRLTNFCSEYFCVLRDALGEKSQILVCSARAPPVPGGGSNFLISRLPL